MYCNRLSKWSVLAWNSAGHLRVALRIYIKLSRVKNLPNCEVIFN
jgi:hypothetical protein